MCTNISTDVLLAMKILPSSPYATFNPKEWNKLSRVNQKFSNTPIKINKKYISTFRYMKSSKITFEKDDIPKQVQLALI